MTKHRGQRSSQRDWRQFVTIGPPCPDCGKRRYLTRSDAKRIARRMQGQGLGRLQVYRCGDAYHVGHPPTALVRGDISRDEVRTKGRRL